MERIIDDLIKTFNIPVDLKKLGLEGGMAHSNDINSKTVYNFTREASGDIPDLEVSIDRYSEGYHIIINSSNFEDKYHRNTGSPIPEGKIVTQVKSYLENIDGIKE